MLRLIMRSLTLASLLGCSSSATPPAPVYDTCGVLEECVQTATLCEGLALEFGGYTYANAICTLECEAEGALSPDCPRAWVGRAGSCYPSNVGGGIDDTLVCFEPCDFDSDCLWTFRCLGGRDLCGDSTLCPIEDGEAICVPGPT